VTPHRRTRSWAGIGLFSLMLALSASADEVDRVIDAMTPRQRLAQLLFVGFSGTEVNDEVKRLAGQWQVGAIVLYAGNIRSPSHLAGLTRELTALSKEGVPPFVALDQEGGEVVRVTDDAFLLPGNMALGATRSPELARRAGRDLGMRLRHLGVTMNLAPVLDVVGDPDAAIDIRAFGSDPALVASLGTAFIEGQSDSGVASVAKHFPGIGRARADSHEELPRIDVDEAGLRRVDLVPFRAAIDAGVDAILLGHAAFPRIAGETPVLLSKKLVAILRDDLRFDGIVITDALEMAAIDRKEGVGGIAVSAILNGADMVMVLWHERDRDDALAALEEAYRGGALTEARVRASLRRILRAKQRRGLFQPPVAQEIARRSITIVRDDSSLVPLRGDREQTLYIGPAGPIAQAVGAARTLHPPVRFKDDDSSRWSREAARLAPGAGTLVAVAQNRAQMEIIRAAAEANPELRIVLVSLGSPSLGTLLPRAGAYVCAYGYLTPSQEAVARVLTGEAEATGRMP
jgi:beta-N-acetylhexosaminidase